MITTSSNRLVSNIEARQMSEGRDALASERDFLFASLDDLDRELAAGDISAEDHA